MGPEDFCEVLDLGDAYGDALDFCEESALAKPELEVPPEDARSCSMR